MLSDILTQQANSSTFSSEVHLITLEYIILEERELERLKKLLNNI